MRLLVTGSRDWPESGYMRNRAENMIANTYSQMCRDLDEPDQLVTLVVGDCPTGIDKIAADLWRVLGLPVEVFVADWTKFGSYGGPERNKRMVMSGADMCLAFPFGVSRGTRGCAHIAIAENIPTQIFEGEHNDGW